MLSGHIIPDPQHSPDESRRDLLHTAKRIMQRVHWLTPLNKLDSSGSATFGRNIEKQLKGLKTHQRVLTLKLRNEQAAVVMTTTHYTELLEMKEAYEELLRDQKRQRLSELGEQFESLYERMQAPAARKAGDALFAVDDAKLRKNYRPGKTETREGTSKN